jgi:hypothetical protein
MDLMSEVLSHGLPRGIVDDKLAVEARQLTKRRRAPCRAIGARAFHRIDAAAEQHRRERAFDEQATSRCMAEDTITDPLGLWR